jgi:hypothetical protein
MTSDYRPGICRLTRPTQLFGRSALMLMEKGENGAPQSRVSRCRRVGKGRRPLGGHHLVGRKMGRGPLVLNHPLGLMARKRIPCVDGGSRLLPAVQAAHKALRDDARASRRARTLAGIPLTGGCRLPTQVTTNAPNRPGAHKRNRMVTKRAGEFRQATLH